jgi:hypothetical protein
MSNIDQRVRFHQPHTQPTTALGPVIGDWEFVTLSPQGSAMREYQPVSPPHLSAIERPRCPACDHQRMLLSKIEAGPAGFDHRTFECQKCGRVQTSTISTDPMESSVREWFGGELKPPQ